jgi:LPXTG-motif cell wall-anchored protein
MTDRAYRNATANAFSSAFTACLEAGSRAADWGSPTAVSLQTLNVPPSNTYIIWLMIGVLLLAFSTYLLIRRKRTI